jgi:MarR family transcriptional regulator, lower aerobic nicotinate degradation pathway regulator
MAEENHLVELVNQWAVYAKETDVPSTIGFCLWYFNKSNSQNVANTSDLDNDELALKIGELIHRLNKFYEFYTKKAIEDTGLSNVEDYVFLASLIENRDVTKSTLIEKNVLEAPSGFDVIKRLEKDHLADSVPAKNDKRARLIRITAKGSKVLKKNDLSIQNATNLLLKPLNLDQKMILADALNSMDIFHSNHYSTRLREAPYKIIEEQINTDLSEE